MKTIYRGKLGCLISPYKRKQNMDIERNTAVYDKVYFKWIDYVGFCLPCYGKLSFLTYNREYSDLSRMFPNYNIKKMPIVSSITMSQPIHIINVEKLREVQSQIINQIENLKERENVWFINLQTGQGKTILAIYLSTLLNLKTWILCFSDNILHQWYSTYQEKTDIDHSRILRVNSRIIDGILMGEIDPLEYDIFLSTPTLLDRFANTHSDYGKIQELFEKCKIGFLIYDEAHRNVSNIVKLNAIMDIRYQVYLSADFGQGDHLKEKMYKEIFRNVPILTPSEDLQLSMKYTKLIVINYNTYPDAIEQQEPFNKYGYNAELYMKYQFKKGILVEAILYILKTFTKDSKYRSLILFTNVEHVEKMYEILKSEFTELRIGMYHGGVSKKEKDFAKNVADITVATYSSFSTGLDTENIKYVLSTNQCNKITDNQSAGRARPLSDGTEAIYFMFVDNGFSYCKRKLRIRINYLMQTKAKEDNLYSFTYHRDIYKGECDEKHRNANNV